MTGHNPLHWWLDPKSTQPAAVKAVLSLAYLRDGDEDPVHDSACAVYGPHADTVSDLAQLLAQIEQLETGSADHVLWLLLDDMPHGDLDVIAEHMAAEKRVEALVTAQLVASLHIFRQVA